MARRNSEAEASTPSEATATEAPAVETPIDTSAFQSIVAAIVAEADSSTGEIAVAELAKATEAYRELDGIKSKNAARDFIETSMREAILGDEGPKAKSYVLIRNSLSAGATKAAAKPKDPTEAYVAKLSQLNAAQAIVAGTVPEGVAEDVAAQVDTASSKLFAEVNAFLALPEGTEGPELSAEAKKVVKLTQGKATSAGGGSSYSGPRRDVGAHIAQAFAGKDSGDFLTVNEIAKSKSDVYGDDEPSSGAISARLFPKSGKANLPDGIEPVTAAESPDGKSRGAKLA